MLSRRIFLRNGAFAMVSLGFAPSFLARTAYAGSRRRSRRLIAIFQRGAVDGLTVVVPYGEAEYYRARPGIAVARPRQDDGAIDLDGFFGLHPRLAPLEPLWRSRAMAVVHACGSPDSTRSHFDAQDFMETATPGARATPDGWLNRYLQARRDTQPTPFRAVSLSGQIPRSLSGAAPALALSDLSQFGVRGGPAAAALRSAFEAAYRASADGVLNDSGGEAFEAMRMLARADPARYGPEHGADYPRSPFGRALRSPSLPRPTSDWRSHSPKSAAGTRTSTRARRRASWPHAWTSSDGVWPPSRPTSATVWLTRWF